MKERQSICLFTAMTFNACDGVCAAVLCLSFLVLAGGTARNDWLNFVVVSLAQPLLPTLAA